MATSAPSPDTRARPHWLNNRRLRAYPWLFLAAFALIFCFGAFANAAAMVTPVATWERAFGGWLGLGSEEVRIALLLLVALLGAPWLLATLAGRLGA